ncbi:polycystic kidney disease 2-like 1 [Pycnococcus provasolii]|uniref:Polycystic kidney disease 2-like 1 n=2 Tax=Pycnococcus provasolii TaxID=41880 RepID=A0A830HIM4_9CHLO|nr:polycystic kidney disease 2-like 1 [Pycnococcus provasolii]
MGACKVGCKKTGTTPAGCSITAAPLQDLFIVQHPTGNRTVLVKRSCTLLYYDFDEISDVSGMWGYLEYHMAGLLFPNENYDGSLLDAIARLYILGNSRVMGAMRLRQVRSVDVNCPTPSWLQDVYGTSVMQLGVQGPGIHELLLPAAQIEKLKSNGWVDGKTRAVVLDTNLLDANFNLFTTMRNIWEMPTIGGVFPYQKSRTFKLYRYVTGADMIIAILEIIFFAMIVWYTVEELIEIRKSGWEYWGDGWNYLDWANLIILYAVYGLRFGAFLIIEKFDYNSTSTNYIDFPPIALLATQELNISAINFFLIYFKIFKYLRFMPRMDSILVTVHACSFDLLLFVIMASIVLFGFGAAFYVSFGADVYEYRTLSAAHSTLALILLGDFDYAAIYDSNKVMAPLLFYLLQVVMFFILLNMFLAIICDAYADVKGNQSEEDLNFYSNLKDQLLDKISNLVTRKRAIKDLTEDILASDRNVDGLIDEDELKEVLKDNPKAYEILNSRGAKDLLAKYDVNQDGVLDKAEMSAILRELAEKEAEIETEMKIAETDEAEAEAHIASHGVGGAVRGGGGGMVAAHVDLKPVEDRIDKVEGQVKELSRNMAKKLSLMIDLMMSLSDQISATSATAPAGRGSSMPMLPGGK